MEEPNADRVFEDNKLRELAAIIDSRGSLTLTRQSNYLYEVYRLTAERETLSDFVDTFGGGIYENGQESGPIWKVSGAGCRKMLGILYPFMVRRREVVAALQEVRSPPPGLPVSEALRKFKSLSMALKEKDKKKV